MDQQSSNNYIFGKKFGNFMAKIDQRTQLEATMMSMFLMMIGLIFSIFYIDVYFNFGFWFKVITTINGLLGLVFMSSSLVTTFQQYRAYMEFKDLQDSLVKQLPQTNNQKGGMK